MHSKNFDAKIAKIAVRYLIYMLLLSFSYSKRNTYLDFISLTFTNYKINMKKVLVTLTLVLAFSQTSFAQETQTIEQPIDSVVVAQQQMDAQMEELKAAKEKQKALAKAEKERKSVEKAQKKAEKAQKKAEKAVKKQEKLVKSIHQKKKGIKKSEMKIRKLQSKLAKGRSKGKMTPVAEMKIDQKINKLELAIAKHKEKLAKLEQKQ
jgi:hypothetical protein